MKQCALADDAVVVRGGVNRNPLNVGQMVQDNLDDGDGPVLSVFVIEPGPGEPREGAVARACHDGSIRHNKVQVALLGDLRAAGFAVADERADDEAYCHYHVHFEVPVTQSRVLQWIELFSEPIPNPDKRRLS